jgi:hypothetical protein
MDRNQRIAATFHRAFELAQTGQYPGWRAVETALRAKYPEIRTALAPTGDKVLIDDVCRQHYRGPDA